MQAGSMGKNLDLCRLEDQPIRRWSCGATAFKVTPIILLLTCSRTLLCVWVPIVVRHSNWQEPTSKQDDVMEGRMHGRDDGLRKME
ncbi:hypothetical protein TNCV_720891 [Trichonephila clavipes]|nr:hypothetical protein TNCV_720891 [Trichonephila clavipes]